MPFRLGRFFRSFFQENASNRLAQLDRSRFARPAIELLERRDVPAAPTITGIVGGNAAGITAILGADAALTLGLDGEDTDGDNVTITTQIINPSAGLELEAILAARTRYAVLNFEDNSSNSLGQIVVQLFEDWGSTATQRFITLSTMHILPNGTQITPTPTEPAFYTDVNVHRVVDLTGPPNNSFIIQTGDAQNGNGSGGSPLGDFPDIFDPLLGLSGAGILAMANSGPNTNDSQWFMTGGPTQHLNQVHMIFGQIVKGMDVFDDVKALGNNGSKLASVDIIEETDASVLQDGVIRVRALNGSGGTATLRITIDDGTGPLGITTRDVALTVLGMTGDQAPQHVGTGKLSFDPVIVSGGGIVTSVVGSFPTPLPGASVTYQNGLINVNAPNSFGTFDVSVKVTREDGYTATRVFQFTRQPGQGSFQVGNKLFVAAGADGLKVYDLNTATLDFLGGFDTDGYARDVKVVGNTAYVADDAIGLVTLNVSNLSSITELDRLALPMQVDGSGAPTAGRAFSLFLEGNTAYVASFHGGLNVVNIASPGNLVHVQNLKGPISRAMSVVKQGTRLFVADLNQGILVFNSANLSGGAIATVSGSYWGLAVRNNRLYGVDTFDDSLKTFKITDPPGPASVAFSILDSIFVGEDATHLALSPEGRQAVIGVKTGFVFVDVSRPEDLAIDSQVPGASAGGLASFGTSNFVGLPLTLHPPLRVQVAFSGSRTFTIEDGDKVTVKITNGLVSVTQGTNGHIVSIDVIQSGTNTDLTITTNRSGGAPVDRLQVGDSANLNDHSSIRKVLAADIDVLQDFYVAGNVKTLKLEDVNGDWDVQGTAGSVRVQSTGTTNTWTASFGGVVTSFVASGNVSGTLTAPAITTFKAASLTNATLKLTRPVDLAKPKQKNVNALTVTGAVNGSSIESKGHVGKIIVGPMTDSFIHVGLHDGVTGLPISTDFETNQAKAALIQVKGSFSDSVVAGGRINKVVVSNVDVDNATQFGVVAQSIGQYIRKQGAAVAKSAKNVTSPTTIETVDDYFAQVV